VSSNINPKNVIMQLATPHFALPTFPAQATTCCEYGRAAVIFAQGDPCSHVCYLEQGGVTLTVTSPAGAHAVIAMLGPGEFFGEGCLAGQSIRAHTATAARATRLLQIEKGAMVTELRRHRGLSARFITHMLARHERLQDDLVAHLFNGAEQRLARTLWLLGAHKSSDVEARPLPRVSQETLAAIVGTTRARVNHFMRKFQRLGLIDYTAGLQVHASLRAVVDR
jgi:CRP/FNR family cyclic AMP-dependent transcriptional regulator